MTRAITVLFVLLLVSNAQPVSAQSNKKQPGPQIPDVNRLLKGVQGKVKRIEDDVKRSPPSTRGEQPQPQRPPTPAPRVPEIPKPQQEQPVPPPRPTASAKNNGQQRPPLQADMLLVDKPVDGLPGGAFVAFSPSGKLLLTSNGKGVAKLWEVGTWEEITFKPLVERGCHSAVFSPDGSYLAMLVLGDFSAALSLWNMKEKPVTQANVVDVGNRHNAWNEVIWSANGETLISRSLNKGLVFWGKDGPKGELPHTTAEEARFLAVSPNGALLAAAMGFHRQGRGIEIRKIPNGEVVATLPTGTGTTDYFRHFDFSPDGKFFVATFEEKGTEESGGRDRLTARLFDTSTWEQTAVLSTDEVAQYCSNFHYAAFSPDSKLVVTTAETGSHSMVTIWNALDGNKIRNITTACCRVVLFFPDGGTMATGGSASPRHSPVHNINFWDVKTGRLRARVAASPTYTIALSPDRRFLVTGDLDEHAWIWDLTNYRKVPYVDECIDGSTQASNGRSSSKSPTGFPVASTDNLPAQQGQPPRVIPAKQTEPPSEPQMFDLPMPERPLASRVHDGGVTGMAVSPDGKLLVTAGHYGDIKIWSFPEGKLLKRIEKANESGVSLAIRPDGKHFVTVTDHNYPKIFSLPDGKRVKTLHWELGLGPFSSVNAGVGIVALSTREGIEVRSLMEGSLIRTLAVEGRMTYGRWLDISRDGRLLAAAHADDVLRLWSLKDGKLIHGDLRFPQFHPGPLSLSPSCDRVAVIDGNIIPSGVKIWSLPDGHLRKIFKISVSGVSTVTFASDDVLLFAELGAIRILSLNENKIVGSIVDQSNVGGMF